MKGAKGEVPSLGQHKNSCDGALQQHEANGRPAPRADRIPKLRMDWPKDAEPSIPPGQLDSTRDHQAERNDHLRKRPMSNGWSAFFVTTGAVGGTFAELLFVVVSLGTGLTTARKLEIAHASLTPALYSFAGVLLQGMVVLVPWPSDQPAGVIFILLGISGMLYRLHAVRMRRGLHLRAIRSRIDRILHNVIPILASAVLIGGGAGLIAGKALSPYAVAGSTTLFLVSGIYRTWGETLALIELSGLETEQALGSR
jgi:hypothetical protein